jgi:hypothetical protein
MYLDTAILVKLLVREPDSDFYVSLVDGQPVWSSQLVLVECFSALLRKERERAITRAHRRRGPPRSRRAWARSYDFGRLDFEAASSTRCVAAVGDGARTRGPRRPDDPFPAPV